MLAVNLGLRSLEPGREATSRCGTTRRLPLGHCGGSKRLGEQCVEQPAARSVAVHEACLQPVAWHHQLIDLGDDAALVGEGW